MIAYEYDIKPCIEVAGCVEHVEADKAEFFGVYRRPQLKWEQGDECWQWVEDFDSHRLACGFVKDQS